MDGNGNFSNTVLTHIDDIAAIRDLERPGEEPLFTQNDINTNLIFMRLAEKDSKTIDTLLPVVANSIHTIHNPSLALNVFESPENFSEFIGNLPITTLLCFPEVDRTNMLLTKIKCPFCNSYFDFATTDRLRTHMLTNHNNADPTEVITTHAYDHKYLERYFGLKVTQGAAIDSDDIPCTEWYCNCPNCEAHGTDYHSKLQHIREYHNDKFSKYPDIIANVLRWAAYGRIPLVKEYFKDTILTEFKIHEASAERTRLTIGSKNTRNFTHTQMSPFRRASSPSG